MGPVVPVGPAAPVGPVGPSAPVGPVGPVTPTGPSAGPVAPVGAILKGKNQNIGSITLRKKPPGGLPDGFCSLLWNVD